MRRREIERHFDAIVDFAGVEKFLETPVKRYSSGMYVRLAFAVAAHLEPEILIVDEVLAVGDADFQRKCLDKMQDVATQGRTVLFVSHNLGILQRLCQRGILLQNHRVGLDAPIQEAVGEYLRTMEQSASVDLSNRQDRRGAGLVRLKSVEVSTGGEMPSLTLTTGGPARFVFGLSGMAPGISLLFSLYDNHGQAIAGFSSAIPGPQDGRDVTLNDTFVCEIDSFLLIPGRYRLNVAVMSGSAMQDHVEAAAIFDVEPGQIEGRLVDVNRVYGVVSLPHRWIAPGNK
jgi:lipopolysaccharide transport system ATP-binding protein